MRSADPNYAPGPRWRRRLVGAGSLAAAVLALGACGSEGESGSGDTFEVGILAPTSGSVASEGEDMLNSSELAIAEVNASGGIDGREIELNVADDACEAQQGVQAAEKLVQDGVVAVVGGYCSAATLPAMEVFNRADQLPFVVTVSSNPRITEAGHENIVRPTSRDDHAAPANVSYLSEVVGGERVAIVHDNTEYSVTVAEEMESTIEEQGGPEIVYLDAVQPGGNDYRPVLDRVAREGADTLFYTGFYPEFGPIARQWSSLDYDYNLVGGASTIHKTVIDLAPDGATDDRFSIVTFPTALLLKSPEAQDFSERYKQEFGVEPGPYGVYQYDGMKLLIEALQEDPENTSHEDLNARLDATEYDGVTGQISFDENGDRSALPYLAVRSVDGEFVPTHTIDQLGSPWHEAP